MRTTHTSKKAHNREKITLNTHKIIRFYALKVDMNYTLGARTQKTRIPKIVFILIWKYFQKSLRLGELKLFATSSLFWKCQNSRESVVVSLSF